MCLHPLNNCPDPSQSLHSSSIAHCMPIAGDPKGVKNIGDPPAPGARGCCCCCCCCSSCPNPLPIPPNCPLGDRFTPVPFAPPLGPNPLPFMP
eukprot:1007341-Pyramimonas_sp.AAC.1